MNNQQIRFCTSADGVRLAYAITGAGLPLLKAPHWLTHLEQEQHSPVWRPWLEAFSQRYRFVRMDERGCGLSERDPARIDFESLVDDIETVADAAGLERFALLGHSQGSAIAVEYAARHPERVSHLILLGGYARGALQRPGGNAEELQAQLKLIEIGWGRDDPLYRQMFALQFIPGGTLEQIHSVAEFQRLSASPRNAARIVESLFGIDVRASAAKVRCPTLVLHARHDRRIPFEEGLLLASLIPGARLVTLETENHIMLEQDASFAAFFAELERFLPAQPEQSAETVETAFPQLTARERDVLHRIAQGLDNAQVAAHLELSEKTVRNHITRIFDKLGVENRPQAIVRAREQGLGRG